MSATFNGDNLNRCRASSIYSMRNGLPQLSTTYALMFAHHLCKFKIPKVMWLHGLRDLKFVLDFFEDRIRP